VLHSNSIFTSNLIFKLVAIFFPFFLISGPFLSDTVVVLLAILFIIHCYINKNFFFCKNKLIIFFFAFYLYININSFFSYIPSVSFATTLPYIRFILFFIFIGYLLKRIINLKKLFFFSFFFSYLILFIDSLIQIKTGYNTLGYPIVTDRVASFFRDKLIMGSYVARTLPLLLAISYIEDFRRAELLRFLLILVASALVFFSAERASIFLLIIIIVVYLIFLPKKKLFINLILISILLILLSLLKPSSLDRLFKHTFFQLNEKNKSWWISERHEMHILTAYRMFIDKKFLGHGIKSFRYLCDKDPFSVENVIIKNNKIFSPIDGYFYIKKNFVIDSKNWFFVVPESQKINFENQIQILDKFNPEDVSKKIFYKPNEEFGLMLKKQEIKFGIIDGIILKNLKNSSKVNKGDFIFSQSFFKNGCNTHPHNTHIQFLSELGLLGYLFLFSFLIYLIFFFFRNLVSSLLNKVNNLSKKYDIYIVFISLGLILQLFPFLPSGNFFNNWLSILFYLNLAFFINLDNFIYKK